MAVTRRLGYLGAADVVTVQSLCLCEPRVIGGEEGGGAPL